MNVTTDTNEDPDTDDEEPAGVEVTCQNCGYQWIYSGEMWNATCPSCGRKTKTPYHEEYEGE